MALPLKEKKSFLLFFLLIFFNLVLISDQVPRTKEGPLLKRAFLAVLGPLQAGTSWVVRGVEGIWKESSVRKQKIKRRGFLFAL